MTNEHAHAVQLRDEDEDAVLSVALRADGRAHADDIALELAGGHKPLGHVDASRRTARANAVWATCRARRADAADGNRRGETTENRAVDSNAAKSETSAAR